MFLLLLLLLSGALHWRNIYIYLHRHCITKFKEYFFRLHSFFTRFRFQSRVVFILGLSKDTTEDALLNYFENTRRSGGGPVEEVKISENTAQVKFESSEGNFLNGMGICVLLKVWTLKSFKVNLNHLLRLLCLFSHAQIIVRQNVYWKYFKFASIVAILVGPNSVYALRVLEAFVYEWQKRKRSHLRSSGT